MPLAANGSLNIVVRRQYGRHLCWAALAASLLDFYVPGPSISQQEIARRVLGDGPVDRRCRLDIALGSLGLLAKIEERRVGFAEVRSEIDAGRALCAAVCWKATGTTHFVLLHGYQLRGDVELLLLGDPQQGCLYHEYAHFPRNYQPGGKWTWTYWTRSPSCDPP